uniref:Uncharacterized protein n=1 Tax=Parascaris univalens TaxID=6257 RepID=A0A915AKJ3_PARUN
GASNAKMQLRVLQVIQARRDLLAGLDPPAKTPMVVLAVRLAHQDLSDPLALQVHLVQRDLQELPARQSKNLDRTDLLGHQDQQVPQVPMGRQVPMATLELTDQKDLLANPAGTAHQENQVLLAKMGLKESVEHRALAITVHHRELLPVIKYEGCYWSMLCDPCLHFCALSASYLAISR